jgi:hypothetical protein
MPEGALSVQAFQALLGSATICNAMSAASSVYDWAPQPRRSPLVQRIRKDLEIVDLIKILSAAEPYENETAAVRPA